MNPEVLVEGMIMYLKCGAFVTMVIFFWDILLHIFGKKNKNKKIPSEFVVIVMICLVITWPLTLGMMGRSMAGRDFNTEGNGND